jgi:predicted ATPase/class 3 adenylate cyclase
VADLPTGTVTFLFTDLEGSTRRWEDDREAMRAAVARHDELLDVSIEGHGGVVFSRMGDGVAAAFGSAPQAVAAAVDAQLALSSEPWGTTGPLRARMGVHTGAGTLVGDQYDSHPLNRCARLMGVAHAGQVLISGSAAALVGDELAHDVELIDLGEHRLRDLARPMQVFQVGSAGLVRDFPPLASLNAFPGNLPLQVSSFIGRDRELARAVAALAEGRVVTLTGVGGVGKTRLAYQVAGEALPGFAAGAWVCELAPVRDPTRVVDAVANVFDVAARSGQTLEQALVEFLRGKQLLLLLDNCEHLLESVAELVSELERSCSHLAVLATSREGFGIDGERILAVPSLRAPGADARLEEVEGSDAVLLFVERAQAVKADFVVTPENASAIAQICRRLDGVPLAIELAAARVLAMNPSELARRLDRRFEFLAGGRRGAVERHQTLRAAIDWSYDLLEEPAQRLLARLAVFSGGCTLDSAEAVCSGGPVDRAAIWELLASLVGQSLVIAEDHGDDTRYQLLETIRQYGEERLDEHDETVALRSRHAEHYSGLSSLLNEFTGGALPVAVPTRVAAEQDNLLSALSWAIDTEDVDLGFRLLRAFPGPGNQVGPTTWAPIESVLALPGAAEHPDHPYGLALAAIHAAFLGDRERTESLCEAALAADQRVGPNPAREAEYGVNVARTALAFLAGDWHSAAVYSEQRVELGRATGQVSLVVGGLHGAAMCYVMAGDSETAVPLAAEALALARELETPFFIAMSLGALAAALADRDPLRAKSLLQESAAMSLDRNYEFQNVMTHGVLVAGRLRDPHLVLQLAESAIRHLHWSGDWSQLAGVLNVVSWAIADADPDVAATLQGAARTLALSAVPASAAAGGDDASSGPTAPAAMRSPSGYITELRRETAQRLAAVLGDERFRERRALGEAMDADQAVAHALAGMDQTH